MNFGVTSAGFCCYIFTHWVCAESWKEILRAGVVPALLNKVQDGQVNSCVFSVVLYFLQRAILSRPHTCRMM